MFCYGSQVMVEQDFIEAYFHQIFIIGQCISLSCFILFDEKAILFCSDSARNHPTLINQADINVIYVLLCTEVNMMYRLGKYCNIYCSTLL